MLLRDDDDLVLAVYDYWLAKRLRLVSCELSTLDNNHNASTIYSMGTVRMHTIIFGCHSDCSCARYFVLVENLPSHGTCPISPADVPIGK